MSDSPPTYIPRQEPTDSVYGVDDYDAMLSDTVRTTAYLAAIARAVRVGDVVVEIGSGVGFFAVAAARARARHVFAIEQNPAVALGPEVAAANGCSDRITFFHAHSGRVTLPERGDVLLEDLRGVLPLEGGHIPSVVDARARLLRSGATIVNVCDTLWAAPCEADDRFREKHLAPGEAPYGISRSVVESRLRENWYRARLEPRHLFAPGVQWGAIAYATVDSPDLSGCAAWTLQRAGTVDGVCAWFDADLGFGCGFSNAPGKPSAIYAQAFFPLPRAVAVAPGDRMATEFRAKLVEDAYVFGWDTTFEPVGASGRAAMHFRQSNLVSLPAPLAALHRRSAEHRPEPGRAATVLRALLALADGSRSLQQIADALAAAHPGRFSDSTAALRYAVRTLAPLEDEDVGGGAVR